MPDPLPTSGPAATPTDTSAPRAPQTSVPVAAAAWRGARPPPVSGGRVRLADGTAAAKAVLEAQARALGPPGPVPSAAAPGHRSTAAPAPTPAVGGTIAPPPLAAPPLAPPPLPSGAVDDLLEALTERVRLDVERIYGTTEV